MPALSPVYRYLRAAAILLCAAVWIPALADDDDDYDVRENPMMPARQAGDSHKDYSAYSFLKLAENRINLNGADWSALRERLDNIDDTVMAIVHIGDSHIQAEGSTTVTRRRLQHRYGSAGRGLIIPFKAAGTNQPTDYTITFSCGTTASKILKQPWQTAMGFTGISIRPEASRYTVKIALRPDEVIDEYFDYIKVFGHGSVPSLQSAVSDREGRVKFTTEVSGDTLNVWLQEPVMDVTLDFRSEGTYDYHGFKIENSMMGVEYSAIGNNGATFSSYNAIESMGRDLQALSPDLVIISLGTNEAFGNTTDASLYNSIDRLVGAVRRANPGAQVLLVTPAECQRSSRSRTYTGRGRRRRAQTVKSYSVNTNVKRMRDVILRYGREKHVPTYDWYAVAGGDGASTHWLAEGLLSGDRIHDTWKGYALHGDLLYDALVEALE